MKKIFFSFIVAFTFFQAFAQAGHEKTVELTLGEAIARARVRSVDAAVALDDLRRAYWEYRIYRAELLPEINFSATLPSYRRQYSAYMNSEGSYSFVRNNFMEMTGALSLSQNIWLTGGTLSLNTSFDFYRDFELTNNRFMSIPVALTLNQPLFAANRIKWDRRIEPERYAEAKAAFLSATEEVAMTVISMYFDLLMARESVAIARQNLANADKLYEVAREKRAMGQISENDLLQMELNLLDAQSSLTERESSLKSSMFSLRSFLEYDDDTELMPSVPENLPPLEITYSDALDRALANNKFARNVRRRQLEADYAVAKAKGEQREINLFAQVGYTGTSNEFAQAYQGLRGNQIVEVGVRVPILDWGRRRGAVKVAESNRRAVESRLRRETMNFNQDLFILVERFCSQQRQLDIACRADTIARKRYATNVETFMIGRISTLDLNDSQVKKDESRRSMISELYRFWYYYYQIRSITLWDYAAGCDIDADFDRIING